MKRNYLSESNFDRARPELVEGYLRAHLLLFSFYISAKILNLEKNDKEQRALEDTLQQVQGERGKDSFLACVSGLVIRCIHSSYYHTSPTKKDKT